MILSISVVPETLADKDGVPLQTAGKVVIACKQLSSWRMETSLMSIASSRSLKSINMRAPHWSYRTPAVDVLHPTIGASTVTHCINAGVQASRVVSG